MEEIWKPAPRFNRVLPDGRCAYSVSNFGRVCSVGHIDSAGRKHSTRILTQTLSKSGVCSVNLRLSSKDTRVVSVARMVAEAFIPNTNNCDGVRCLDGNAMNCAVWNLEWYSRKAENQLRAAHARQVKLSNNPGERNTRPVRKYNLMFKLVAEYPSANRVPGDDKYRRNVIECCKRNHGIADGHMWRYADDDELRAVLDDPVWRPVVLGDCRDKNGRWSYEVNHIGVVRLVSSKSQVQQFDNQGGVACVKLAGITGTAVTYSVREIVNSAFRDGWLQMSKKPIRQYDLTGKLVAEFGSIEEAGKSVGAEPGSISKCCRGLSLICANSLWQSVLDDELYGKTELELRDIVPGVYRQYTKDGKLIAEYVTQQDAIRAINRSRMAFANALNKRHRTCGGFVWFHSSKDEFRAKDIDNERKSRDEREKKRLSFGWKE